MECLRRSRVNSVRASSEQGTNESPIPLDPSDPSSLATLNKAWRVSDDKGVGRARDLKVEIPAEVFLARLGIGIHASVAELMNQPFRYIISETAGVDEIAPWLGNVKSRACE